MKILAITGATGFVGKRTVELAVAAGYHVRALTRRPQAPRKGVVWVRGSLERQEALRRLAEGCEAVIHIAGVVNAPDAAGFTTGNVEGTANMLAAAEAAGVRRFVHVSSLAAREPDLSQYGLSKARAEACVQESGLDWAMVRPPAVYGPGDHEMLDLFKLAQRGFALLPPGGRLSLIHADDLARLLIALAGQDTGRCIYEPDDGVAGGWSHVEYAHAIGDAVGKRVRAFSMPRFMLDLGAKADALFRKSSAKLTPDRVAYFCHPDWVANSDKQPPAALWKPEVETHQGLSETAAWYRANGLL